MQGCDFVMNVEDSLKLILEGTINESHDVELDLKKEKWCSCKNPTGFRFIKAEGHEQIWRHIQCGGLVLRSFIKRDGYEEYYQNKLL